MQKYILYIIKVGLNIRPREWVSGLVQTREHHKQFRELVGLKGPPLWSSGQSFWLQIQRSRVRFPALPDFSE